MVNSSACLLPRGDFSATPASQRHRPRGPAALAPGGGGRKAVSEALCSVDRGGSSAALGCGGRAMASLAPAPRAWLLVQPRKLGPLGGAYAFRAETRYGARR